MLNSRTSDEGMAHCKDKYEYKFKRWDSRSSQKIETMLTLVVKKQIICSMYSLFSMEISTIMHVCMRKTWTCSGEGQAFPRNLSLGSELAPRFSSLRRSCSAPSGYTPGHPPMGKSKLRGIVPIRFFKIVWIDAPANKAWIHSNNLQRMMCVNSKHTWMHIE